MDVLGDLALTAAAGALAHEDKLVFVGSDDGHGGEVGDQLALAAVEEHGEDTLFGAWAGIEVVGEDLLVDSARRCTTTAGR